MVRDSQGIIEPVMVLVKGSRYGLGYTPTDDNMKMKKKNGQALAKRIPHLYQSFLFREYAEHEDLGEGIYDLFKEIDVIFSKEVELACIRDTELGEKMQNLICITILIP